MGNALTATAANRLFLSGNDAVAHAARDAGVRVAAAYPGTPSTEILEVQIGRASCRERVSSPV